MSESAEEFATRMKGLARHARDEYLEKCRLSCFPVVGERRTVGVRHTQSVNLHCSCRLPEEIGDKMAECDVCKPGTTNTAWMFLTMFLKKNMSPGSVNHVPQYETLPNILL